MHMRMGLNRDARKVPDLNQASLLGRKRGTATLYQHYVQSMDRADPLPIRSIDGLIPVHPPGLEPGTH